MPTVVFFNNIKYFSSKEAGELAGYTNDYVARLCRKGKLPGRQMGRVWYVEADSFLAFLLENQYKKAEYYQTLSEERKEEYQHIPEENVVETPVIFETPRIHAPLRIVTQKFAAFALSVALVFGTYLAYDSTEAKAGYKAALRYAQSFVAATENSFAQIRTRTQDTSKNSFQEDKDADISSKEVSSIFRTAGEIAVGVIEGKYQDQFEKIIDPKNILRAHQTLSSATALGMSEYLSFIKTVGEGVIASSAIVKEKIQNRPHIERDDVLTRINESYGMLSAAPRVLLSTYATFIDTLGETVIETPTLVRRGIDKGADIKKEDVLKNLGNAQHSLALVPDTMLSHYADFINTMGKQVAYAPETLSSVAEGMQSFKDSKTQKLSSPFSGSISATTGIIVDSTQVAAVSIPQLFNQFVVSVRETVFSWFGDGTADPIVINPIQEEEPKVVEVSRTVVNQPVIERVVQESRVVIESGVTEEYVRDRLENLNNKLASEIYRLSGSAGNITQTIVSNYNTIAQSNNIDDLGGVSIHGSTFSGGTISSSPISGASGSFTTLGSDSLSVANNATIGGNLTVNTSGLVYSSSSNNFGIGTTTPFARLSISGASLGTVPLFAISTSTAAATSTVLIVDSQGRVGVGTTSPGAAFSVQGDVLVNGNFTITDFNTTGTFTAGGDSIFQDGFLSQASSTVTGGGLTVVGYSTTTQALIVQGTSATSTFQGGLAIETTGLVYDYSTGRVGIGTASPAYELDVTGEGRFTATSTASYFAASALGAAGAPAFTFSGDPNTGIWSSTADTLNFSTAGTERARFDSSGNFGIGTTSPYAKLSVVGEVVAPYFTATSTTATSTFAGALGVGTTSPAQLFSVAGNGYVSGGFGIGRATTTAGVLETSSNAYIGGNLIVIGDSTIIGESTSDSLTINSTINSNLIPDQNAVRDVGSPSFYWDDGFFDTITANNLSAASTTISGTQAATFTINSDNATADTESSDLIFFRGTVVPNALLSWDSTNNRFDFNQSLFIQNDDTTAGGNITLEVRGSSGQTGDYFRVASSTNTYLNVLAGGNVGVGTSSPYSKLTAWGTGSLFEAVTNASTTVFSIGQGGATTTHLAISNIVNALLSTNSDGSVLATSTIGLNLIPDKFLRNDADDTTTGQLTALNFVASSASATSTFAGGLAIETTGLVYDFSTGRVGIGTASPSQALDVVGSINASSALTLGTDLAVAYGGTGLSTFGGTNTILYTSSADTLASNANFVFDGTNVGIGTTSPYAKLSVVGEVASAFFTATTTTISTLPSLLSTNATTTSLYIASLTGPLQAVGGLVSASSTLSASFIEDVYLRNNADDTTSGQLTALNFVASSASATSTFAGGLAIETTGLVYDYQTNRVGIGTASPGNMLQVGDDATASSVYLEIAAAATQNNGLLITAGGSQRGFMYNPGSSNDIRFQDTTTDRVTFQDGGNVGIGTTSPYAKLSVVGETVSAYFTATSTTATSTFQGVILAKDSGLVGIGTSTPWRKLSLTSTVSNPQFTIAYDTTRYADLQVDSVGDLILNPQGDDLFLLDDNLYICADDACPTGSVVGTGNLVVETKVGVATSTPWSALAIGAGGAVTTVEKTLTDGATVSVDWRDGNQQVVTLGGNRTINFSGYLAGQTLRLLVCQDGTGSRTVTWGSGVLWDGGTAPTLTTTASKCDVATFLATYATSTVLQVFGSSVLNF